MYEANTDPAPISLRDELVWKLRFAHRLRKLTGCPWRVAFECGVDTFQDLRVDLYIADYDPNDCAYDEAQEWAQSCL